MTPCPIQHTSRTSEWLNRAESNGFGVADEKACGHRATTQLCMNPMTGIMTNLKMPIG